jgi:HK97 gp10 family phage protein
MAKSRVSMKITGAEDVLKAFNKFDTESRIRLRAVVKKNATSIRKAIQARAPVDSGNLKKSIGAKYDKDQLGADVGPKRPLGSHAHLLEFGTVKMPAKPFITPAVEEQRNGYLEDIRDAVKGAVK